MQHPHRLRWRLACAVALSIALGLAPMAMASETQVIHDWQDDGFIQGHYSIGDLRRAPLLMKVLHPPSVGPFLAVVNEKIAHDFLGINEPLEPTGSAESPPVGDLPSWFVATAIGAALLALGGAGSAIYRRARRGGHP